MEEKRVPVNIRVKSQSCSAAAAAAKSLQSCPTLCDPMNCTPGLPVHHQQFPLIIKIVH